MINPVLQQNVFIIIVGSLSPLLLIITKHSWHFLTKTSAHQGFSIATVDYQRVDWMMFTCSAIHFLCTRLDLGIEADDSHEAVWEPDNWCPQSGCAECTLCGAFLISRSAVRMQSNSVCQVCPVNKERPKSVYYAWDHIGSDIGQQNIRYLSLRRAAIRQSHSQATSLVPPLLRS